MNDVIVTSAGDPAVVYITTIYSSFYCFSLYSDAVCASGNGPFYL